MVSRDPPEILAWKPRVDACALSCLLPTSQNLQEQQPSHTTSSPLPLALPFDYMGPILLDHAISQTKWAPSLQMMPIYHIKGVFSCQPGCEVSGMSYVYYAIIFFLRHCSANSMAVALAFEIVPSEGHYYVIAEWVRALRVHLSCAF